MARPTALCYAGAALTAALLLAGCGTRVTPDTLQGDWMEVHPRMRYVDAGDDTPRPYTLAAFAFRGDRVQDLRESGAPWQPYRMRGGRLTLADAGQEFYARFVGDTLLLIPRSRSLPLWFVPDRFVRVPPPSEAHRPERIAVSIRGEYRCVDFDLEIDRSGTVRYEGYCEGPRPERADIPRPKLGRHDGTGQRVLYDRWSRIAAAARADTPRERHEGLHDDRVALVMWYGGRPQVHLGTRRAFADLRALIDEAFVAAEHLLLDSVQTPYRFESRAALEGAWRIPEGDYSAPTIGPPAAATASGAHPLAPILRCHGAPYTRPGPCRWDDAPALRLRAPADARHD